MADSLLDNYNPLYDVHLRQYFALPHMQKHLRNIGLLQGDDKEEYDDESELYARHHAMMDMMLRNRETQLAKLADVQKKLDAAEKVEICRKIRSGITTPESYGRAKPSRSLSRSRNGALKRQRRSSTSTDDKDLIKKIETENEEPPEGDPHYVYNRLSASVGKYRYLHKLDDDTLSAYMEQLRRQLDKLERFREVSFGPHSVAKHQSEPHVSWFFRRRSLPSLSDSEQANTLHEPLRSVQSLKFRSRLGKSTSPRKLNESHDSRATYPLTAKRRRNSESNRLPPIGRNGNIGPSTGSSGASKLPPKNRTVPSKRRSNSRKRDEPVRMQKIKLRMQKIKPKEDKSDTLPALAVVGVSALAGGTAAAEADGLESSMNAETISHILRQADISAAGDEVSNSEQDENESATAAEGTVANQNDTEIPMATSLLAENEPEEETASSIDVAQEQQVQTKPYGLEQQQETPNEQIPPQQLLNTENGEPTLAQSEIASFEPEAIKVESPSYKQGSLEDQENEAAPEEEPEEAEVNEATAEEGSENAISDPGALIEETQLQQAPFSTTSLQPPSESPIVKDEENERNTPTGVQSESLNEEGRKEVTSQAGSVASDEGGEERRSYGGTTAITVRQLSEERESGSDAIISPEKDTREKEVEDDEGMGESRLEQEETKESAAFPAAHSDELPTEVKVEKEPLTTPSEFYAAEGLTEQDGDSVNQGDVEANTAEQQNTRKETRSDGEEISMQQVELPETDHEEPWTVKAAEDDNVSVGSNKANDIQQTTGGTETDEGQEEQQRGQTHEQELRKDLQQLCSLSRLEPLESPGEVQEAGDEQSTVARSPPASPNSAEEEKATSEQQSNDVDIVQQSSFGADVSNVESANSGMSWEVKDDTPNGPESSANQEPDDALDATNLKHSETSAITNDSDADDVAPVMTGNAIEEGLNAVNGEPKDDAVKAELKGLRRKRSAGFEEDLNDKGEEVPSQEGGSESHSPQPDVADEGTSVASETEESPRPTIESIETAVDQDFVPGENDNQPVAAAVSQVEQAPGGMSWEVDDATASAQTNVRSATDLASNDGVEAANVFSEYKKTGEEVAQPEPHTAEALESLQEESQLGSFGALEGNDEQSGGQSVQTPTVQASNLEEAPGGISGDVNDTTGNAQGNAQTGADPTNADDMEEDSFLSETKQVDGEAIQSEAYTAGAVESSQESSKRRPSTALESNDEQSGDQSVQTPTVHASNLEEAPDGTSWDVNDTTGNAQGDAQTEAAPTNADSMEADSVLIETKELAGEAAQPEPHAVEDVESSQELGQRRSSIALEQIGERSGDNFATTSSPVDDSAQPAGKNGEQIGSIKDADPKQTTDANLIGFTAAAVQDVSVPHQNGIGKNIRNADDHSDTDPQAPPENSQGTEISGNKNVAEQPQEDQETTDFAAASEVPPELESQSFRGGEAANLDNVSDAKQTDDGVAFEIPTVEETSQKQLNLVDENANHPNTVDGEQEQQNLGNKTNGNTTDRSEGEQVQPSEQLSSPLQMLKNTPTAISDEDSRGNAAEESKADVTALIHETPEGASQTSI